MPLLLSVLIPVYNNAAYLPQLYSRLVSTLEGALIDFELILVNDGSRDKSWDIISEVAKADRRVKAICLSRNFGQHAAISAALEHSTGDCYVLMDADLQDRPELIPSLLAELSQSEFDIVYTTKTGGEDGIFRYLTSRAFHSFVGSSTGTSATANVGTFRAFNRGVADALRNYRERAVVYGPLMHTMGYRTTSLSVPRDARTGSSSSYTFSKRVALALQSIISYSTLPQKLLLWAGAGTCSISALYMFAVIVQYLLGYDGLARGFTLLAVLILFLMGVVILALSVLAAYMFLIYREILDRPRYHIQHSINLDSA